MALLPTCGRLYAFYNIKWVYCISLAVFELGSVVSALAPNSIALIIGRAVSGFGAAGLVSGTTTILSYCVSLKNQAILSPIVLGVYNIGSAIGPLVGGSITDSKVLTWRFVFWVNLRKSLSKQELITPFRDQQLKVTSFWGCWASSHLAHAEATPARSKGRPALGSEAPSA
jgi:MFS family permease